MALKDWPIIDEDCGREVEIMMAKMLQYDGGKTIYGRETSHGVETHFLGYELKRYKKIHPRKRAFVVGTTICRIYRPVPSVRSKDAPINPITHTRIINIDGKCQEPSEWQIKCETPGTLAYNIINGIDRKFY